MRAFVAVALMGAGMVVAALGASPAFAVTITEPSGNNVQVTLDAQKYAAPFTVTAAGFEPYENVFIEQCNGRPPAAADWTPTLDCDLGSAPAAAVADAGGKVTFAATDPNHAPFLFVGPSPQELFNCLSPKGTSPGNGSEDYRNCQIRVSTSNAAATDDQVFLAMTLPEGARTGTRKPPEAIASAANAEAANQGSTQAPASDPSKSVADAAAMSDSASSQSGAGSSTSSSFPYSAVLIPAVLVALGAAYFLLHKRRSGRVAA